MQLYQQETKPAETRNTRYTAEPYKIQDSTMETRAPSKTWFADFKATSIAAYPYTLCNTKRDKRSIPIISPHDVSCQGHSCLPWRCPVWKQAFLWTIGAKSDTITQQAHQQQKHRETRTDSKKEKETSTLPQDKLYKKQHTCKESTSNTPA